MTIASIDIGTNTVLLLLAEINRENNSIVPLKNLYAIPRIGKGVTKGLPISENKIEELFSILSLYKKEIDFYNCEKVILTATASLRNASNSEIIIKTVKEKFCWEIEIISGKDEAYLSYLGATSENEKNLNNFVIDIGGGSTELILGKGKEIFDSHSFNFGVVILTEKFSQYKKDNNNIYIEIKNFINKELNTYNFNYFNINEAIAIAGTPTTIAAINCGLTEFDEEKIEGYFLTLKSIKNLIKEISFLTTEEIYSKYQSVVKGREDVLLAGAIILETIMEKFILEKVKVSTKGIRYGAIQNYINKFYK